MIKYLGSKRLLLPLIGQVVGALEPQGRVLDLFSGTARVGHALKRAGYAVTANDHNVYAATLARCYVESDLETEAEAAERVLSELARVPPRDGWFTETYCRASRFFRPENGARIEAIRERIAELALPPRLDAVVLTSLMEAADRVDSTTGVQMAYLKSWAPRAHNPLELRLPALLPRAASGPGRAVCGDALRVFGEIDSDIAYLDPPYNQHRYIGNYHVWETLVRWDSPEVYGVACKRVDSKDHHSAFNSRGGAAEAMESLIAGLRAKHLVISFSDEGYIAREDFERMLASRGHVHVIAKDFKRYVGAQIGVYNPQGERVGEVSHLRNTEFVYVASADRDAVERVATAVGRIAPDEPQNPRRAGSRASTS
jgi:adenine-specific DNA-methyltransferase